MTHLFLRLFAFACLIGMTAFAISRAAKSGQATSGTSNMCKPCLSEADTEKKISRLHWLSRIRPRREKIEP